MDWLRLGLVLLIVGNIKAQGGYNYPKPKTPFSDVAGSSGQPADLIFTQPGSSDSQPTLGSQQPTGANTPGTPQRPFGTGPQTEGQFPSSKTTLQQGQKPFGTQQPSNGYPSSGVAPGHGQRPSGGYPNGRPQPSGGYPGPRQPATSQGSRNGEIPSGGYPSDGQSSQRPSSGYFQTGGSIQRPFGRPSGEYSTGEQTQQPSGGYPTPGQIGSTSGQKPSGGYPTPEQSGPLSTQQPSENYPTPGQFGSLGTQQPLGSYPTPGESGTRGGQKPFGSLGGQQPSGGYPTPGQSGSLGGEQPSGGYPTPGTSVSFNGQQPSGGYPTPEQYGTFGGQQPSGRQPNGSQRPSGSQPSTFSLSGGSQAGSEQGYTYPTPPRPFPSNVSIDANGPKPQGSSGTRSSVSSTGGGNFGSRFPSATLGSISSEPAGETGHFSLGSFGGLDVGRPSSGGYPQAGSEQVTPGKPAQQFPSQKKSYRGQEPVGIGPSVLGRPAGEPFSSSAAVGQGLKPGAPGQVQTSNSGFIGSSVQGNRPFSSPSTPGELTGPFGIGRPNKPQFPSGRPQTGTGTSNYPGEGSLPSYLPPAQETGLLPLSQAPVPHYPNGEGFKPSDSTQGSKSQPGSSQGSTFGGRPSTTGNRPGALVGGGSQPGSEGVQLPSGRPQQPNGSLIGFGKPISGQLPSRHPGQLSGLSQRPTGPKTEFRASQGGQFLSKHPVQFSELPQRPNGPQIGFEASPGGQLPVRQPGQSYGLVQKPTGPQDVFKAPAGGQFPSKQPGQGRPTSRYPSGLDQLKDVPQTGGYPSVGRAPSQERQFGLPGGSIPGYGQLGGQREPGKEFTSGSTGVDGSFNEPGDLSAIPGEPGRDYPVLSEVPETSFNCDEQEFRGYYADVETRCQIFHICAINRTYDFICPNGTIFHQEHLVCVWWNDFDCNSAPSLYRVNANIYDFSIIGAKQTGGMPIPGQQYPGLEFPAKEPIGFPSTGPQRSEPGVQRQRQYPQTGGYQEHSGSIQTSQASGGYPTGLQGIGYPSESFQQGRQRYSDADQKRPVDITQRPGQYPRQESNVERYPGREPQTQDYVSGSPRVPVEPLESSHVGRPGTSGGYSSGKLQGGSPSTPETGRLPSSQDQGVNRYPLQTGVPSRPEDTQIPFGGDQGINRSGSQVPGGISQQTGGYSSQRPQGSFPSAPERIQPQFSGSEDVNRLGYSTERPEGTGFPSRPGSGGPSSAGKTSGQYGVSPSQLQGLEDNFSSQRPSGYPSGTSTLSGVQGSTPSRQGSQEPSREYLPAA